MSTGAVVAIIVVVVIVAAVLIGVTVAARRRRLQRRFGPEYDRVVGERQSQLKADSELASRERRVRELDIRPLSESARANYATQWRAIQEEFVDQPEDAVVKAQHLVTVVMNDRGYPTDGHDQMLADLSVEHAGTLEHYRSAYAISQGAAEGNASTEDLRQAMIRYRTLFSDLLGDPAAQEAGIRGAAAGRRRPEPPRRIRTSRTQPPGARTRAAWRRTRPAAPPAAAAPVADPRPPRNPSQFRMPQPPPNRSLSRIPRPPGNPSRSRIPRRRNAAPVADPASAEDSASEPRREPASRTRRR